MMDENLLFQKSSLTRVMWIVLATIAAMAFPVTTVNAASISPFRGRGQGTDPDGSEIRLTIAARPDGPFRIT
jgi:hypothetical protein